MHFILLLTLASGISASPAHRFLDTSKAAGDAPYDTPEATLRAAVKILAGFTYGQKIPVIMCPGTGVTGTQTFSGNFMKQLANSTTMDPVVLDIPDNLLDDIQPNAEFLAYSTNYVSAISSNLNVSVITWSQGFLNMQWAMKYWPSTRAVVSNFVPVSPDLKGSKIANGVPTGVLPLGEFLKSVSECVITTAAPSLLQQASAAAFISTLHANGGDTAYVPTTAVYNNAAEIGMPQDPPTAASGFFNDVLASNSQVQAVCSGQPAGGNFTHEGMLCNPLAFALAMDAITNGGPSQVSRLNL
jgi:hypothetical protein